ncbi:alpha/beta fold hydrolase [Leifsonia sp. AG29]|uniref:alpha/beta fold hydrolase n=1 Tax=Leifsonia sp. AG29 TaxID=2598860 RepID=UPI00131B80E7|nr:alpha/beta hydrolase [Leifsonia sp. AG29]
MTDSPSPVPTVVLVHGAFADAGSWAGVADILLKAGVPVIGPAVPLRGLASDSAYIASVFAQIEGPILPVGHSYGGALISNAAAGNPNVKGLVFVSGFAPEVGEALGEVEGTSRDSALAPALVQRQYPSGDGGATAVELFVDTAQFYRVFAGDLPEDQANVLAATQRPVAAAAFDEKSAAAAWKDLPSWAVVARGDKAAGSDVLLSMAQRAGAELLELEGSHVIMISQPQPVADVIMKALKAVGA